MGCYGSSPSIYGGMRWLSRWLPRLTYSALRIGPPKCIGIIGRGDRLLFIGLVPLPPTQSHLIISSLIACSLSQNWIIRWFSPDEMEVAYDPGNLTILEACYTFALDKSGLDDELLMLRPIVLASRGYCWKILAACPSRLRHSCHWAFSSLAKVIKALIGC